MFKIPLKGTVLKCKKDIWCYNKANYNEICRRLESVQWESIVEGKDVEQEWFTIKGELLRCMHELVPKKEEINKKQPLWMKKRIKKLIKGRNWVWKNFKDRPSYVNQRKLCKRRNEVCNEIRAAKKKL